MSLSVLALGTGAAELLAVFLLDFPLAGFTDFSVFFGHIRFGYFSTAVTEHHALPCDPLNGVAKLFTTDVLVGLIQGVMIQGMSRFSFYPTQK